MTKEGSPSARLERFLENSNQYLNEFGIEKPQLIHKTKYTMLWQAMRKKDALPVIVKLGANLEAIQNEAKALLALQHHGCVPLLASKDTEGLLVLEKIEPGHSFLSYFPDQDDEACHTCLSLMNKIFANREENLVAFTPIKKWLHTLFEAAEVDEQLLIQMRKLANYLLSTQAKVLLLHGDLHQGNILSSGSDLFAIDPIGIVAEKAFESASFITYPMPHLVMVPNLAEILKKRILFFAKQLNVEAMRIQGWAAVRAMTMACSESKIDHQSSQNYQKLALTLFLLRL